MFEVADKIIDLLKEEKVTNSEADARWEDELYVRRREELSGM